MSNHLYHDIAISSIPLLYFEPYCCQDAVSV